MRTGTWIALILALWLAGCEATMRRRSIVLWDCDIRVRGLPPKPAAVAAADEAPRPEPA